MGAQSRPSTPNQAGLIFGLDYGVRADSEKVAPVLDDYFRQFTFGLSPCLTIRFLFAYYDLGFPGPTVGRHEYAPRSKERGKTVVREPLGASQSCTHALL